MSYQVVLLSGKQGSGKSTIQKEIERALRRTSFNCIHTINFADILYEMHDSVLKALNKWHKYETKKDGKLLQVLGTEWGRNILGTNIWVHVLQSRIQKITQFHPPQTNHLFVVGDCRFRNEFNAFSDALRVRLEAPADLRKIRTTSWREGTEHPSEVDLDGFALEGKFDMYLNTLGELTPEGCASLILAKLQKNNWKEKRNEPKENREETSEGIKLSPETTTQI